jgi:anti-sigma factor RsiW
MIPADQHELIAAAVDGELSATETRAFRRLLDSSAEARALFAKLKADRDRVRALPRVAPPADLQARILKRIAASTPAPVVNPARPRMAEPARRAMPVWVPVAAAASLLLSVTAVSFAFYNGRTRTGTESAKNPYSDALPATAAGTSAVPSPTAAPRPVPADPDAVARVDVSPVPPAAPSRPVAPEAVAIAPEPRPVRPDFIGAPPLPPIPPLDFIKARVPFLRPVADLDRDDTRQELADELGREPTAYRLDLFVRDTARGVELFQNTAKAAGLTLHADATTLGRLKNKQVATVVVYTESFTAAELSGLFAKLAAEDTKYSPRVCDSLHALPAVSADEKELSRVLGVNVGLFKRPTGSGAGQGTDRGDKNVSAGTIDSVSKSLNGTAPKPGEQTAVLLTWQSDPAWTKPAASAEVKQYLAKRGPRKPGAVPAVVVIRAAG